VKAKNFGTTLAGGIFTDTVVPVDDDWNEDVQEWLEPFLAVFKRCEQRC
jgi:hypothetical protein